MGIIFDTSAIIAIERGHESLDALIAGRAEEPFGISVITAAELLHGVERADTEERKLRRQAFVENYPANVQWEGVDLSDVKTMWFSL